MKNFQIIILLLIFNPRSAQASLSPACRDLYNIQLKLAVHASNLFNAATARTSNGGVYRKGEVLCRESECRVIRVTDKKIMYEPGHPHADRNGYVSYPNIDTTKEFDETNSAALELSALAKTGACNTSLMERSDATVIRYHGADVISDSFNFSRNRKLVSWVRHSFNGKPQYFNFPGAEKP